MRSLCCVQTRQKMRPQARQWCLRRARDVKGALQPWQWKASISWIHRWGVDGAGASAGGGAGGSAGASCMAKLCVCVCVCVGGLRWLGLGHVKMMMELGREVKQNTFPFHLHQKPKVDDRYHHARCTHASPHLLNHSTKTTPAPTNTMARKKGNRKRSSNAGNTPEAAASGGKENGSHRPIFLSCATPYNTHHPHIYFL